MVDRNIDNQEEIIKTALNDSLEIEYTNYAIAINGENKVFLSNEEEAQNVVNEIKNGFEEKYTQDIGIVQVYSENNEDIASTDVSTATEVMKTEVTTICNEAKKKATIKLASAKKTTYLNGITLSVKPVSGSISSRFGYRSSPGGIGSTNHKGIDIAAACGSTIKASASGTVTFSGYKGSLGNLIIIDHGNGIQTYYGHCSKLCVSAGDVVSAGDKIAEVGMTGSATGYHLHFEVHKNGTAVNPQNYIY